MSTTTRAMAPVAPWGARGLAVALCTQLAVSLLVPLTVHAYCRASTETPATGPCIEIAGAPLLHWERGCMTFRFHQSMFDDLELLDEDDVRFIVEDSFVRWEEVNCGFEPFVVQFDEQVALSGEIGFVYDEPNESVIASLDAQQWEDAGQSDDAFAVTFLWHDTRTGELLDVDIGLNQGRGPFGKCGDRRCTDGTVDLQNTFTHEAGHVLGLGHSNISQATMVLNATAGAIFMRDLDVDDRSGLCALDLPSHTCETPGDFECACPEAPVVSSINAPSAGVCACSVPGGRHSHASGVGALGVLAMLAGLAGRRRIF